MYQQIYTKSFRNAIGVGARAFRCDYEGGGVFYEGGVKDGGTQPTITPLIRNDFWSNLPRILKNVVLFWTVEASIYQRNIYEKLQKYNFVCQNP